MRTEYIIRRKTKAGETETYTYNRWKPGRVSIKDGELSPASSLCLQRSGLTAQFATLFTLSDDEIEAPTVADPAAAGQTIAWTQAGGRNLITLTGASPGRIRAILTRQPA